MRLALTPHPDAPSTAAASITVDLERLAGGALTLVYSVTGSIADLTLPPPAPPERTDELWRHTCFEVFIGPAGAESYCEFNFAPSTQWAAYRFSRHREGMTDLAPVAAPVIHLTRSGRLCEMRVSLDLTGSPLPLEQPWRVALSAVIETRDGARSYWALAHPPGKADFHHPDAFALTLAPPEAR